MNTTTLAAGVVGFLLGGLVTATAASLEDDDSDRPAHGAAVIELRTVGGSAR